MCDDDVDEKIAFRNTKKEKHTQMCYKVIQINALSNRNRLNGKFCCLKFSLERRGAVETEQCTRTHIYSNKTN